jgi:DNA invertase Pin-like site-specific DNA recombinase
MGHLLGYARVSTVEQNPALQDDALRAGGCVRIWTDVASGARDDRPQLALVLDRLLPGDTLVVWRLDRLGRSLRHLIDTVRVLDERGVGFRSLTESIDTSSTGGRLVFHVFGALAEFERDLGRDRTLAGLQAARDCGRHGGRPPKMTTRRGYAPADQCCKGQITTRNRQWQTSEEAQRIQFAELPATGTTLALGVRAGSRPCLSA